jgi:hypothetical protein
MLGNLPLLRNLIRAPDFETLMMTHSRFSPLFRSTTQTHQIFFRGALTRCCTVETFPRDFAKRFKSIGFFFFRENMSSFPADETIVGAK